MAFLKDFTTATGTVVKYHKATRVEATTEAFVVVNSWASKEIFDAGGPLAWQDTYGPVPYSVFAPVSTSTSVGPVELCESWLISEDGPFSGGVKE